MPKSSESLELAAWQDGYICEIDAMKIGIASQHTGAGREKKDDDIDLSAGIYLYAKVGAAVEAGQIICTVYGNDKEKLQRALEEVKTAIAIGGEEPEIPALIKEIIE